MLVEENKSFLLVVTSDDVLKLKVKKVNFLFPISGYSVGFLKTYSFEEVSSFNAYVYINRILDNESVHSLKEELKKYHQTIKGICFTDMGVLEIVKDLGLNIELIYMQNHATTNRKSINYLLDYVDSVLISTDITKKEIMTILDHAKKKLVVPYFMLVDAMYSRRRLLSNFQEEFSLEKKKVENFHEEISGMDFQGIENDYGTVFYAKKFIDYRILNHENIKYYFINPLGLSKTEIENILSGKNMDAISDKGFLEKETYYRLKEEL